MLLYKVITGVRVKKVSRIRIQILVKIFVRRRIWLMKCSRIGGDPYHHPEHYFHDQPPRDP